MEMSLAEDIKKYELPEGIVHYITHVGKIMGRQDFRNRTVVLEKLSNHPVETYKAIQALQLVPGFQEDYLSEEAA